MKRIICAALAVGLLAAGPLAGRPRAEGPDDGGDRAHHMEKMLKEKLGLSDDQAAKLKAAWDAKNAAVKPLREQAKESRRKLEEQIRDLASDKDIQATLDQMEANRKSMMAERQKVESALASVLKPYQRAKLILLMARMKGRGGREDRGGWGRHEGGPDRHEGPRGWGEEREGDHRDND